MKSRSKEDWNKITEIFGEDACDWDSAKYETITKILELDGKAEKWDRLQSIFENHVDWRHIRFIALSQDKTDCDIGDFSKLYPWCKMCMSVRTDNGRLCRRCVKN